VNDDAQPPKGRRPEDVAARLGVPDAVLSRTDLATLGYTRRAIDVIFRRCPVVALPGFRKPMILVRDYRRVIEEYTYRSDRVRPTR
jgi:hypothetical protein